MTTTTTSTGIILDGTQKPPVIIPGAEKPYKVELGITPGLLDAFVAVKQRMKAHNELKLNTWLEIDPRPHTHPWNGLDEDNDGISFESTVIQGYLVHRRWKIEPRWEGGNVIGGKAEIIGEEKLEAGMTYQFSANEAHEVIEVWRGDKGQPTVTMMRLGRRLGDGNQWGNLVVESGELIMAGTKEFKAMDPTFLDRMLAANLWMKDPRPPKKD